MASSRTQYILGETFISVAINTALSIAFVFAAFHGMAQVPVRGTHGILVDMAPQTFMVTLMGSLVPALLTRKRSNRNSLTWHLGEGPTLAAHVWISAITAALVITCTVMLISWFTLPQLLPNGAAFYSLLACKALFGALLAASVTPWAIRRVLR